MRQNSAPVMIGSSTGRPQALAATDLDGPDSTTGGTAMLAAARATVARTPAGSELLRAFVAALIVAGALALLMPAASAAENNYFQVELFVCSSGHSPSDPGRTLENGCQDGIGITVQLVQDGFPSTTISGYNSETGTARLDWTRAGGGDFALSVATPAGHEPYMSCVTYAFQPTYHRIFDVAEATDRWSLTLPDDNYHFTHCKWFFFPEEPVLADEIYDGSRSDLIVDPDDQPARTYDPDVVDLSIADADPADTAFASVSVRVHSCPDDFVGNDSSQYDTFCTSETGLYGVPISLTAANQSELQYSQPAGDGRADPQVWTEVAPGAVTIEEVGETRIRESVVFCSLVPGAADAPPLDGIELLAVEGAITLTVAAGDRLNCEWHRFPGGIASEAEPQDFADGEAAADTDGDADGLTDAEEPDFFGSDPNNADSDFDGLSDGDEVYAVGTDPLNPDTDWDGISDYDELNAGTDPLAPDGDAFDAQADQGDSDGDGIADADELNGYGTDPFNADTDFDGLYDADELWVYATDPLGYDTDGDGIGDGEEIYYGTDPLDPASY
jgi:hypothetical protein